MKPTSYIAAVRDGSRFLYLSTSGTWIVRSAFEARGTLQMLRTFRYEESAKGAAEEWARQTGMEPHVEAVR